MVRQMTQPRPGYTRPYLWPEVLIEATRGDPEVPLQSGCRNGAIMPPEAPSTWIGMSRPVSAWMLVQGRGDLVDRLVHAGVGDAHDRHDADGVLVDVLVQVVPSSTLCSFEIGT